MGVIVDNLKGDMSEFRCCATFWKKKKKSATGDKKNKCKHKCFQGKMYNSLPALHSYTLKRAVDQYNGDLFNMSN